MTQTSRLTAILITLGLLASTSAPARAQATEEDMAFLQRIMEAANTISTDTAREAYGQCTGLAGELAKRSGVDPLQRLYLEAELESCFSYAMNNGNFSDATGDSCSHHLAFATKLAQVITDGNGKPGFQGELMSVMGDRLDRATELGPQLGCTADYTVFEPAVALAKAAAAQPLPEPDFAMQEEISTITSAISATNAKDSHAQCQALQAKVDSKADRTATERNYLSSLIQDCSAIAMEIGQFSDASGDKCAHHFAAASLMAEAMKTAPDDPAYAPMNPVMESLLDMAISMGPVKGCTQDYGALKKK